MRFRRNNGSPVSFFAFQDVITGVAGVMLIVMFLVAIGKRQLASDLPQGSGAGEASRLQSELAQIEAELALTRAQVAALRHDAAAHSEARENAKRIQMQTTRNRELAKGLKERQKEARELEESLQSQANSFAQLAPETAEYLTLLDKARILKRAWRSAKLQLAPETEREVFVLDCARGAWRWSQRGRNPELLGGEEAANPAAAWRALEKKLKTCKPDASLFIVAVRPSAGGFIAPLTAKIRATVPNLPIAVEPLADEYSGGVKLE